MLRFVDTSKATVAKILQIRSTTPNPNVQSRFQAKFTRAVFPGAQNKDKLSTLKKILKIRQMNFETNEWVKLEKARLFPG